MSNSTPRAGPSRPSAPRRTSTLKDSSAASSPVTSPVPTPTRKQSAVSSVAERKARREQLRNFYGIRDDASSGTASPGKGVKAAGRKAKKAPKDGERDPNEGGFDAEAYYEELVGRATLAELMNTASTLSSEISNLHSSRHSLVYNHHHQLFAAGDTISVLNSRTPQLLSIVTSLQDSFSSISQLADSIALSDEPDVEVDPVERGVQRLRLMIVAEEPPERIRKCYESFRTTLEKLVEVDKPGARELQDECEQLLASLPVSGNAAVEEKDTT